MKMRSKQGYTKSRKRSKSFEKVSIGRLLRSSGRTTKIICPGDRWNQPAILSALRFLLPGISRAQPLVMYRGKLGYASDADSIGNAVDGGRVLASGSSKRCQRKDGL